MKNQKTQKKNKIIGIYGIQNTENSKWYVGQSVDVEKRITDHFRALEKGSHKNRHLQNAFNRYGRDSFQVHILQTCNREDLERLEIQWISEKDAYTNGYNKTTGGEGVHDWVPSTEYRNKMSEKYSGEGNPYYGRKHSEETRKKLRESHKGKRHGNYGKHLPEETRRKIGKAHKGKLVSEETRRKLSEANRGKPLPENTIKKSIEFNMSAENPLCKPVRCIETGIVYHSAAEAARQTGLERSKISACCRGSRHTTGGFSWGFFNKSRENYDETEGKDDESE